MHRRQAGRHDVGIVIWSQWREANKNCRDSRIVDILQVCPFHHHQWGNNRKIIDSPLDDWYVIVPRVDDASSVNLPET